MVRTPENRTEKGLTFFVTTGINGRVPVFGESDAAQLAEDTLQYFRKKEEIELYGFVVMPDHVHFLAKLAKDATVSKIVKRMKTFVSRQLGPDAKWEKGFWSEVIEGREFAIQKLEYMHENPVRAGLVKYPEDYKWSSAKEYAQKDSDKIDTM